MHSIDKGTLPILQNLSKVSQQATVLSQLTRSLLVFLGQLCNKNCKVELNKSNLKVYKEEKLEKKKYRN